MRLEIYETPTLDILEEDYRMDAAFHRLSQMGITVCRYDAFAHPDAFAVNDTVRELVEEKGNGALPILLVDGELRKWGEYPKNSELLKWCNKPCNKGCCGAGDCGHCQKGCEDSHEE